MAMYFLNFCRADNDAQVKALLSSFIFILLTSKNTQFKLSAIL